MSKQQFLHDTFTMGAIGEKNWADSFSVQCVYKLTWKVKQLRCKGLVWECIKILRRLWGGGSNFYEPFFIFEKYHPPSNIKF